MFQNNQLDSENYMIIRLVKLELGEQIDDLFCIQIKKDIIMVETGALSTFIYVDIMNDTQPSQWQISPKVTLISKNNTNNVFMALVFISVGLLRYAANNYFYLWTNLWFSYFWVEWPL